MFLFSLIRDVWEVCSQSWGLVFKWKLKYLRQWNGQSVKKVEIPADELMQWHECFHFLAFSSNTSQNCQHHSLWPTSPMTGILALDITSWYVCNHKDITSDKLVWTVNISSEQGLHWREYNTLIGIIVNSSCDQGMEHMLPTIIYNSVLIKTFIKEII